MRLRFTISMTCLAIVLAGGLSRQPSSGQQQFPSSNRKPACGCYACGVLLAVEFPNKAEGCYGILATDACPEELARMPDKGKAYCQAVKTKSKNESLNECQTLASYCNSFGEPPPPATDCEKPTSWFGSPSGCKEVQSPVVAINAGGVTLTICGSPVFRWAPSDKDPLKLEAYQPILKEWVQQRVGSKVCCDNFREAARTGIPCYPGVDVDCDGKPNQNDRFVPPFGDKPASYELPDLDRPISMPEGSGTSVDPFPQGLNPDDTDFFPPQDKCDCKWQLVKGKLNCSPDGRQRHFYEARWRCPSTGNERYTRKYAAATAPCP